MGLFKNKFLGLITLVIVFTIIIFLNLAGWPAVAVKYHPWVPRYGGALEYNYARYPFGNDRSWKLYGVIEKHFHDWDLISFAKKPSLASDMYNMNYGGFRSVMIRPYQPDLSGAESSALLNRQNFSAVIDRLNGKVVVIIPDLTITHRRSIILRTKGIFFIVPQTFAPIRYADL
jgi:hypothetical protein